MDSFATHIATQFERFDGQLLALENRLATSTVQDLPDLLASSIDTVTGLMRAYVEAEGMKPVPEETTDILDVWKVLVKGDPTWNAIRDNCRELVYYRNCLAENRSDALPAVPQKMAVRTARHIYLYVRTRCLREGRLPA